MSKDKLPKAYAATPHGQTHYRYLPGDRARGIVLIHWLPLSSRMYAHVMPLFAAHGHAVVAVDLLGYGRSDPRPDEWSMRDWALTVRTAAAHAGLTRAAVLGGHSGACVACELAIAEPEFVSHLVLDGCPFLTPELKTTFAAMRAAARPRPSADGAHERLAFQVTATTFKHYLPGFEVNERSIERIWPAMIDYLETDFVSSAPISAAYDLAERLPLVQQPLLLLGAETDTLAASFAMAQKLRPDARACFFKGDHPIHSLERAAEFTAPILEFIGDGKTLRRPVN